MAFPLGLTSVLSGTTKSQLIRWRDKGLIVPEVKPYRPPLYSMRDIIALRYIARLRTELPLQRISKAFKNLDVLDMMEHPSAYQFDTDGTTIFVATPQGEAVDILEHPGQRTLFTFKELAEAFKNFRHEEVVDFRKPAPHLEVDAGRLGGWPTIAGTRIGYNTIADMIDGRDITVDNISDFYPTVSPQAAQDAISFDKKVRAVA